MLLHCLFSVPEEIWNAGTGGFSCRILSYSAAVSDGTGTLYVSVFVEQPHDVVSYERKKRKYGMIGVNLSADTVKNRQ